MTRGELSCGELSRGEYLNIVIQRHLLYEYPKIDTLNILNLGNSLS